jgi:hypothetical protein
MAKYSVEHFRSNIDDIARPYHFDVEFRGGCFEDLQNDSPKVTASIRTASLPGLTVNEVGVSYYGITYKLAGTPTYEPLTCQFIIDGPYSVLADWTNVLNKVYHYKPNEGPFFEIPGTQPASAGGSGGYMGQMVLRQLYTTRDEVRQYTLEYAYLSAISAISYGHETKDSPLTFDATITYTYYYHGDGTRLEN